MHGPFMEEFMMRSKEGHMFIRELQHMLQMAVERCTESEAQGRKEKA